MRTATPGERSLYEYDTRSKAAAGLCLAAPAFGALGWLLAVVGIALLRRSGFSARTRWGLATLALSPKLLFLVAQQLSAPRGLSFPVEPWTLATSSSLWGWTALLMGFGVFAVVLKSQGTTPAQHSPAHLLSRGSIPLKMLGLVAIGLGAGMLFGILDGFHRIDDLGDGRWALKHAARGTLATFSPNELAGIEATGIYHKRGPDRCSITVTLADGRKFSATTSFSGAFQELRDFATTADLPHGTVRLRPFRGTPWTNGESGFSRKDFIGTYEHTDTALGERSTFEFLLHGERLEAQETRFVGSKQLVRMARNIRLNDTGKAEFESDTVAQVGQPSAATWSFSLRWSSTTESAQLTKLGLDLGSRSYTRL